MAKLIQRLLLFVVFVTGLVSILATSSSVAPPLLIFHAVTQNDYEDNLLGYRQAFACQGEKALLKWANVGKPRLSADPVDTISPKLENRVISDEGSLDVTILGNTALILDLGGDTSVTLNVGLIPDDLCTGFGFPLVGWYSGQLEQAAPSPSTLERQLRLFWTQDSGATEPSLRAELAVKLSNPFQGTLQCDYQLTSPHLLCTDSQGSLTLEGDVSAGGLAGTYSGTTEAGVDFNGRFTLQKQTGAPPQEAQ